MEEETKWPPFCRQHFLMDFLECIFMNSDLSLFLGVQLTIFQHWFRWWLGTNQATSHYLNQWWLVYWCIHASLGLNELTKASHTFLILLNPMTNYISLWVSELSHSRFCFSVIVQILNNKRSDSAKPLFHPMFTCEMNNKIIKIHNFSTWKS